MAEELEVKAEDVKVEDIQEKPKTEVIDLANDKKFSEFSKEVKTMLDDKLRNHPTIQANAAELEKYTAIKDTFDKVDTIMTQEEPADIEEPEVE